MAVSLAEALPTVDEYCALRIITGLSRMIMDNIMTFVATLPASTIVNLFADIDWLYQKFGFVVPDNTTGMSLRRG